jgi:nicotinamide-nucleotide amidase
MRAEIVAVGTELLLGQIANTNARWMSEQLAAIGVDVLHHRVVGDNLERIVETLGEAAARADVVLVCGGLGPTQDDLTRDAIAAMLDAPLEHHDEIESMLRERFAGFSSAPMPESNLRQAQVPAGVRWIVPERGTAPGLIADLGGGRRLYAVPGVPREMVEMMEGTILPELAALAGAGTIASRVLRLTGVGESAVAELLGDLFDASDNPTVAFLASAGEVKVRLTAKAATPEEAGSLLAPLVDEVRGRLGDAVFSDRGESLEETVLSLLRAKELTIACAESLTGGSVSARLAAPAGASRSFRGGAVVYLEEVKRDVLGVTQATLDGPGVVSEACAREMAAGARRLFEADIAISLTGAAGPEPHGGRPPGTVWIALDAGEATHARGFRVRGERERVIRWAQQAALDLVRRYLEGRPLPVSDTTI